MTDEATSNDNWPTVSLRSRPVRGISAIFGEPPIRTLKIEQSDPDQIANLMTDLTNILQYIEPTT